MYYLVTWTLRVDLGFRRRGPCEDAQNDFFLKEPLRNKSLYIFLPGHLKAQLSYKLLHPKGLGRWTVSYEKFGPSPP